jgi:hypothetical protein
MKKQNANVVKETTSTAGTGTVTMVAAVGWSRFDNHFANNDRVYYSIRDGNNWEIGYGTYVASHQLARTTILGTLVAGTWTTGGAAMTLVGPSSVRVVAPEKLFTNSWQVEPVVCSTSVPVLAGTCNIVTANSITLTLPSAPAQGDRLQIVQGAPSITGVIVDPGASDINNTAGTMSVDIVDFDFTLVYVDAAYGWKVAA